jgi:hypothetical protein
VAWDNWLQLLFSHGFPMVFPPFPMVMLVDLCWDIPPFHLLVPADLPMALISKKSRDSSLTSSLILQSPVFVGSDLLNFKVANSHEFLYNIFLFDHV